MRPLHLVPRIALTLLLMVLIAPAPATLATSGSPEGAQEEATADPSAPPTDVPTEAPTEIPTEAATTVPTDAPTEPPTVVPTEPPTALPTVEATPEATAEFTPSPELTAEATLETLLAPAPLVARVEPVTEASLMAARTFIVNLSGDLPDANGADNFCDVDLGTLGNQCSLRAAITEANELSDKDTINFNIPGTGPHTIIPGTQLPVINQPVIINGMSEPGYTWATPQIVLQGPSTGSGSGLRLNPGSNGSTIKGLVVGGWAEGIEIQSANNLIQANFLGTTATGTASEWNFTGVALSVAGATGNTIGGTSAALRNLISANTQVGVWMTSGATLNRVQGNFIGTDKTGNNDLGNQTRGVAIVAAINNTIGGTVAGARNVISGNGGDGVLLDLGSDGTLVQGNYIGLRADGSAALGNDAAGVNVNYALSNVIGGTVAGARNVISGNGTYGVLVQGTSGGNRIQGNYIGANPAGAAPIPNALYGVIVAAGADATVIGGTTAALRNVISGNDASGILIVGDNTLIAGNHIGTNAAGTAALSNSGSGITINGGTGTIVGGTVAGAGNRIAYNALNGVTVTGGNEHRILSNLIYANTDLGIDLGNDGVTLNDINDLDNGPNDLQNYPWLDDMRGSRFVGRLPSSPSNFFRLQFFASPTCDPSEWGEGQRYLGTAFVGTDANGDAYFDVTLPNVTVAPGWLVTATATAGNFNVVTSEFSRCIIANLGVPALVSPANGALITDTTPEFRWNPVPYAQGYALEGSLSPTFPSPLRFSCVVPGNTLSCIVGPLEPLETYYWRVHAQGIGTQVEPWSVTRRFNLIP